MELTHSRGQFLRGGSGQRRREVGGSTANPVRKQDWKLSSSKHPQQRHSHPPAAQHASPAVQQPEHGEQGALPRSSSFEPQTLQGPQQQQQPHTIEVQARSYTQRPSASFAAPGAPPRSVYDSVVGGGSDGSRDGVSYSNGNMGGREHPTTHHQPQYSGGGGGGIRQRPSSARNPGSHASLVYRKAVAGGRGGGTGAAAVGGGGGGVERTEPDAMQASFFPLLSVDDEVNPGQQSASHYHRNSNFNENERNGQFSCTIGSAPVAAATSAAKPALDPATKIAPISSRPFASKPVQQRDRGIGQPFRAHPATPSPTYHSISHSGCQGRSAEGVIASSGNASGGSSSAGGGGFRGGGSDGGASNGGERHKPFTPRSLALDSDASAELIASRASPQQNASARSTSGFSSTWGGGGGAVDGGSSQVSGGGHEDSKGQIGGQHNQPLSRQLLRSTNASTASSPSASCASSPRGWARDGGAILGYGGSSSIGGGVIAPPHGSRADIGEGSGGAGGRRYSQGVMRPPKSSNGDASGVINNSNSGESNAAAAGRGGVANDSTTRAVPAQARGHGDEGNTGIEGVLLPGPEGGVEVREFDGGVLMVRRNEEQKKKSPERLNLHRRRLRSCPVVQGDTRLRLLNYQNNLISKVTNVANLPNLIFLDLYNNNIDTMEGPLSMMVGLRVMMIGKNKITKISNLGSLRKLDVLDLHSNSIRDIEGLASLQDLRVLNLAGNQIRAVENVRTLTALTELNLRRNNIEKVTELDALPRLQRLFLSNNRINSFQDCSCIFSVRSLLELSLDGNPVAGENGLGSSYRRYVLHHLPDLRHLDLKRVTDHDQPFSKQQQQQQHSQRERGQQSSTMRSGSVRGKGVAEERSLAGSAVSSTARPSTTDGVTSSNNTGNHGNGEELPFIPGHHHHHRQHSRNNCNDLQPVNGERGHHHLRATGTAAPGETFGERSSQGGDAPRRIHHSRSGAVAGAPSPPLGARESSGRVSGGAWEQAEKGAMTTAATAGDSSCSQDNSRYSAGSSDGGMSMSMSRAAEAREAVAAKRSKEDKDERERRALRERREAIEAARECWERRGRASTGSRTRHPNSRKTTTATTTTAKDNGRAESWTSSSSSSSSPSHAAKRLFPSERNASTSASGGQKQASPHSPTPPTRQTSSIGAPGGGADKTKTAGGGGGGGVDARRSRETSGSSSSGGQGSSTSSGGGGGGGSGGSGGGVGYFELEQRLSAAAAEGGARSAAPGARKSSGGGISITLKVYGDVWRWLADDKVCSLREQVVEARFSLVHVTSVAKKAAVIAQTFPYLSCLQLLDNDIRSLKQIERLRPLLRGLASLHLGKNPVTKNASAIALRAWVAAQSRGLLLDLPANDIGDEGQKRVAKHPANITPGRATQPGGGTHAPPPPPTAQRPIPPPGGGEHDTGHRRGEVEHHSGESGTVEPSSPPSPSRTVSMPVATATGDVRDGCGAVDCGDFLAAGTSQMTSQVAVAFERLAQARNRAATSSWGAVALARLTAAENRTGRSVVHGGRGEVARDSAGAWAASSRGAKLACNGMVRRVCETHKRDGNFDEAWESAVKRIVKGVLTETRVNAEDDQARRHSASTGNWCGSTCSTGEHSSETAATDGRGTTNSDVGRGGIGGTSAYGVRTYTPRAQWLDDW